MRHLVWLFPLVGVCLYSASLAQTDVPPPAATTDCRDVALTRKPGWTLSGSFNPDGSQLMVVDSLYSTILRYQNSGESLGPIRDPIKSLVADQLPVTGKARGEDFILEVSDGLMLMDKNLHPVATKGLRQPNHDGWSIIGLWEWQPVGKTDIVAFVDMGRPPNPYDPKNARTAFIRFPLQEPEKFEVLDSFALSDLPNKGYYRSTYQYITSLGDTAYYLSMNKGLALFRQEKGKKAEDVSYLLPKGIDAPALPDWMRINDFVAMMGQVEKKSMPAGLIGWRDFLYLLYKTPQGDGTRWVLYKIDPSHEVQTSKVDLPISATHVTVIPGSQKWAFVEKGPVLGYGAQEISHILFVPSSLLDKPLRSGSKICKN